MNNKLLNLSLKNFKLNSPVAFVFNINWKVFETFKMSQFEYIKKYFRLNGINLTLLPIVTDITTTLEARLDQFKSKLEGICDRHSEKCSVIAYWYF